MKNPENCLSGEMRYFPSEILGGKIFLHEKHLFKNMFSETRHALSLHYSPNLEH